MADSYQHHTTLISRLPWTSLRNSVKISWGNSATSAWPVVTAVTTGQADRSERTRKATMTWSDGTKGI